MMGKKEDCNQRRWAAHCLPAFPLPVVKIREVSSAMSLKHLSAVLARSLYCPKRVVPNSGNLESMAACPSGKWSGKLSKCALKSSTRIICWLSLCTSETSCCMCENMREISASVREEERGLMYTAPKSTLSRTPKSDPLM